MRPLRLSIPLVGVLLSNAALQPPPACGQATQPSRDEARQRYERGKQLLEQGRYEEAAVWFRQAMRPSSLPGATLLSRADRELSSPKPPPGIEPSGELRERLSRWHTEQAKRSLAQQEYLQALAHAMRALELTPRAQAAKDLARQAQRALKAAAPPITQQAPPSAQTTERGVERQVRRAPARDQAEVSPVTLQKPLMGEYHISPGDVLEVFVLRQPQPLTKGEYRLTPGDVLEVFVWQQPDLSRDVIVRPDGRISFPLVGDLEAAGLSLTQLDHALTERMTTYLRFPDISVAIKEFDNTKAVALAEVARTLSRDVVVRPDGRIAFPLVGDLEAAGLTLSQLDAVLTERVKTYLPSPDVSLAMKRFGGTKTIVLGEVERPGVYVPVGEGRVLEVIAMAGGFTRDAVKRNVVLVRGGMARPQVTALDLQKALSAWGTEENVVLHPNDILFVPKTKLASVLDFMDRFYPAMSQVLIGQNIATGFGFDPTVSDDFKEASK